MRTAPQLDGRPEVIVDVDVRDGQGEYAQKLTLIQSMLAFNAYSEGWALYAEQLAAVSATTSARSTIRSYSGATCRSTSWR